MRSLLPLSVYCISLLLLLLLLTMQQMSALPLGKHLDTVRSDLLQKTGGDQTVMAAPISGVQSGVSSPAASTAAAEQPSSHWLTASLKRSAAAAFLKARAALSGLAWARPDSDSDSHTGWGRRVLLRRSLRVRRSIHRHHQRHHNHHKHQQPQHNSYHSKSNKDGCPLGTCSVHNLSHRLYQLIGESGRENSSPINPRSPHSYG